MFSKAQAASLLLSSFPLMTRALPTSYYNSSLEYTTRAEKSWKLVDQYEGEKFFDSWDFFSAADPTHGLVNYLPEKDATSKGLAKVTNNVVTISVDSTTKLKSGDKRNSVRITSKKKYNGGLFIADFAAMPLGCSTWPAYWSVGPNWPSGGEIDVIEGVHESKNNQIAMHTSAGCAIDKSKLSDITGKFGSSTDCTSSGSNNAGCQTEDTTKDSFGQPFNKAGGGVIAHIWDDTGIRVWHWPRGSIPPDVKDKKPNPSSWGKPVSWLASGKECDVKTHFHDHNLVINTALCGDWAGNTYKNSGCPGTCADAVADPSNFKDAVWKINYIHAYN